MRETLAINSDSGWFCGATGGSRTSWLAEKLFERIKTAVSTKSGQIFSAYSPLMSFSEESESLRPFFDADEGIIKNEDLLRAIRKTLWISPRRPLGRTSVTFPWISVDTKSSNRDLALYRKAILLVESASPEWKARRQTLAKNIIPLKILSPKARAGGVGFSSQFFKGAVFLSRPYLGELSAIELAINLAHEIGHQSLYIYQASDRIIVGDLGAPVYSAIRKTERPAILAYHALSALALMIDFSRCRLDRSQELSQEERAYLERQLSIFESALAEGLKAFENVKLTRIGADLRQEFSSLIQTRQER